MNEPFELRVIEGQKMGASAPMADAGIMSVGNDYDCDVVLGLPGIEHALVDPNEEQKQKQAIDYPKLEMQRSDKGVMLRVVRGNIQIGEETLNEGAQSELLPNMPVTLGQSVFVVGPSTALQTVDQKGQKGQKDRKDQTGLSDDQNSATDADAANALEQASDEASDAKPKRGLGWLNAVAGLCVVVGGIIAFANYGQSNAVGLEDVSRAVEGQLEGAGYGGLTVSLLDNGGLLINGFLDSRAELYEARSLLETADTNIEWDVQLGDALVDSVQSVYQVNGVTATVTSVSPGSVVVETNSADIELLQRIEKVAYEDVANLEDLELINTVPVAPVIAEKEPPASPNMDSIPGKRIVMIVAGEYILTEDGSVYYQGSVLPSGHKVLAILDKKIQVELNDSQIELTF